MTSPGAGIAAAAHNSGEAYADLTCTASISVSGSCVRAQSLSDILERNLKLVQQLERTMEDEMAKAEQAQAERDCLREEVARLQAEEEAKRRQAQ